jgi:peptide deformylase
MALRRILRIDDPTDHKLLTTRSQPVKLPNPTLQPLIDDMIATMHAVDGAGLAAPQIGLLQRIVVIFLAPDDDTVAPDSPVDHASGEYYVLINPEISKTSAEMVIGAEGCLSLPGWYAEVPRARWVTVDYQDLHGKRHRIRKAEGRLSQALQHEIDHLNGVLYTERIQDMTTFKRYRPRRTAA